MCYPPFPFADETVYDRLFNGIKFKDLPYVTIICAPNNIKVWANSSAGKKLDYVSPMWFGFANASKRTNVAGQVTGTGMGQRLRNQVGRNTMCREHLVMRTYSRTSIVSECASMASTTAGFRPSRD